MASCIARFVLVLLSSGAVGSAPEFLPEEVAAEGATRPSCSASSISGRALEAAAEVTNLQDLTLLQRDAAQLGHVGLSGRVAGAKTVASSPAAGGERSRVTWSPGSPTAAVVPPGQCVFGGGWHTAPLLSKESLAPDTRLFTFGLPNASVPLGLSTCAAIMARAPPGAGGPVDADGEPIAKPYTPVSTNAMLGKFELMVKIYPDGALTPFFDTLEIGQALEFEHLVPDNVKIQYPFGNKANVGMIVGGTGITPMIQALHAILGTPGTTKATMLYASTTADEILAKETLDAWSAQFPDRLTVVHVLSREPKDSAWTGMRGHIGIDLIKEYLPKPSPDTIIFVCGKETSGFYDTFAGPRRAEPITGLLGDLGYTGDEVYKF